MGNNIYLMKISILISSNFLVQICILQHPSEEKYETSRTNIALDSSIWLTFSCYNYPAANRSILNYLHSDGEVRGSMVDLMVDRPTTARD